MYLESDGGPLRLGETNVGRTRARGAAVGVAGELQLRPLDPSSGAARTRLVAHDDVRSAGEYKSSQIRVVPNIGGEGRHMLTADWAKMAPSHAAPAPTLAAEPQRAWP